MVAILFGWVFAPFVFYSVLTLQSVKLLKTDISNSFLANHFQPEVGLNYSHPVLWLLLNIPLYLKYNVTVLKPLFLRVIISANSVIWELTLVLTTLSFLKNVSFLDHFGTGIAVLGLLLLLSPFIFPFKKMQPGNSSVLSSS